MTKTKGIHIGTIIGDTVISLSNLEKLGYLKGSSMKENTFQSKTLNPFLKRQMAGKLAANEYMIFNHSLCTILIVLYVT